MVTLVGGYGLCEPETAAADAERAVVSSSSGGGIAISRTLPRRVLAGSLARGIAMRWSGQMSSSARAAGRTESAAP